MTRAASEILRDYSAKHAELDALWKDAFGVLSGRSPSATDLLVFGAKRNEVVVHALGELLERVAEMERDDNSSTRKTPLEP